MPRKNHEIHTYKGINIYRKMTPGPQLRWSARGPDGLPIAADTLAGIKELIREYERKPRS